MALGNNLKRKKLIPDEQVSEVVVKPPKATPVNQEDIEKEKPEKKALKQDPIKKDEEARTVKITVTPSLRKSVKKVKVTIEGKLNLYNANYLVGEIKPIISDFDIIDLKLENIEEIDLSAIQTLYYFREMCARLDKSTSFNADGLSIEIKTMLVKTKYNKVLFKKSSTKAT